MYGINEKIYREQHGNNGLSHRLVFTQGPLMYSLISIGCATKVSGGSGSADFMPTHAHGLCAEMILSSVQ